MHSISVKNYTSQTKNQTRTPKTYTHKNSNSHKLHIVSVFALEGRSFEGRVVQSNNEHSPVLKWL